MKVITDTTETHFGPMDRQVQIEWTQLHKRITTMIWMRSNELIKRKMLGMTIYTAKSLMTMNIYYTTFQLW